MDSTESRESLSKRQTHADIAPLKFREDLASTDEPR
jgi:hypothetical protein